MVAALKKIVWKALARIACRLRKSQPLPIDFKNIQSALIVRPDRLGDAVLSIPVYESIKKNHPHIKTYALVNKSYAEIFSDNPFVDEIIGYDPSRPWRLAASLKKGKFDLAITLNKKFSASATLMTWLSGARYNAGYKHEESNWLYDILADPNSEPRHEVLNNLELLKALRFSKIIEKPRIYFSEEENSSIDELLESIDYNPQQPLVLIKMGSRIKKWGWASEKFICTVEKLLEGNNVQAAFIVGPGEENEIRTAIAGMAQKPWILPPLSIIKLAALIEKSSLLFCNHTGIMHLASATGTPALVIFKHGEIPRWGPFGNRHIILEERGADTLAPDAVLDAISELLYPISNPSLPVISE